MPPFNTSTYSPPPIRSGRFHRLMREIDKSSPTQTPTSDWNWPSPPSPIDLDIKGPTHTYRPERFAALRYFIRSKTNNTHVPLSTPLVTPLITPVNGYTPPPQTIHERECNQLMERWQKAKNQLDQLYSEIHLRMFVLGLLRPKDYVIPGSLERSLRYWLSTYKG